MTLTLDIPKELEAKLRQEAHRLGLDPAEYARLVLFSHLAPAAPRPVDSVSDLFARWQAGDGPADAADVAAREAEFEAFKDAMNRSRTDAEGPGARKPYP